jgi:NADH-quinone oxidoreductase subunit A
MGDFFSVYIYLGLIIGFSLLVLALSGLFPSRKSSKVKFMAYESGIQTETHLLRERFPIRHYLVALMFLVFDVEVVFLYPWAVIAKKIGPIAFYEMMFFIPALIVGFIYVWRKGGLQWD